MRYLPGVLIWLGSIGLVYGQGVQIGQVLLIHEGSLRKDINPQQLHDFLKVAIPSWKGKNADLSMEWLEGDRGGRKGSYLIVCNATNKEALQTIAGKPFSDEL